MGFVGKIIEFTIGLLVLPRILILIWAVAVAYFGIGAGAALIFYLVMAAIILVLSFVLKRRILALGFLLATIWDVIRGALILG